MNKHIDCDEEESRCVTGLKRAGQGESRRQRDIWYGFGASAMNQARRAFPLQSMEADGLGADP